MRDTAYAVSLMGIMKVLFFFIEDDMSVDTFYPGGIYVVTGCAIHSKDLWF